MNKFNNSVTQQQVSPRNHLNEQRITIVQQKHFANDYGLLTKAIVQHTKKAKRKKLRKASLQVYSEREHHCQSLDKLTLLHQQKNQQIRNHIYEKAALQAQNEQLKLNLLNPTARQNQLYSKIQQLQVQLASMAQQLEDKEKKHRKEIEQLKTKHSAQLASVSQSYNRQTIHVQPSNVKYYQPYRGSEKEISPPKQVIRTYQNDKRLIVENSNELNSRTYRVYPESKENIAKATSYSTNSQPYLKSTAVGQQNSRQNMTSTNMGYQNVFIKPQTANNAPLIYSMSPNFVRESDSPKKNSPDTSKNTTHTYNYSRNEPVVREQNNISKASNAQVRQISPQYRSNVYSYEKVTTGQRDFSSKGVVTLIKTDKQEKTVQSKVSKPIVITNSNPKPPIQAGNIGVSEKQIDDIYKRYYLHDK